MAASCFCLLPHRTSHRVIIGEHDRSSNAEDIQVMRVGKVGDKPRHRYWGNKITNHASSWSHAGIFLCVHRS